MIPTTLESAEFTISLWKAAVAFVRLFECSRTPNTIIWCLELYAFLADKYVPKNFIQNETKLRKELHDSIGVLLSSLASISANDFETVFPKEGYGIVLPLPPTIYNEAVSRGKLQVPPILQVPLANTMDNNQMVTDDSSSNPVEVMLDWSNLTPQKLTTIYRLFAFRTLKRIGLVILQKTYSQGRDDRIITRVCLNFPNPI